MQTSSDRETLRSGRSGSGGDGCATEQIVGRERRERLSQLAWCGGGCFDSRRRVNSTVGLLILLSKETPVMKLTLGALLLLLALPCSSAAFPSPCAKSGWTALRANDGSGFIF